MCQQKSFNMAFSFVRGSRSDEKSVNIGVTNVEYAEISKFQIFSQSRRFTCHGHACWIVYSHDLCYLIVCDWDVRGVAAFKILPRSFTHISAAIYLQPLQVL